MKKTKESKELVRQEPQAPIVVFDPEKDIARATIAAKALMKVVERTKPLEMNGKKYLYFEHWQTIGQFFNHTVGTEWTRPIMVGDNVIGFEAKSVLYHDGKVVGGAEAACMGNERNWSGKPLFQIRSMAQTRAMSKALRSRFGFIPVLVGLEATPAEEMTETQDKKAAREAAREIAKQKTKELQFQKMAIMNLLGQVSGVKITDGLEAIRNKVMELTGLNLIPDQYEEVISRLQVLLREKQEATVT